MSEANQHEPHQPQDIQQPQAQQDDHGRLAAKSDEEEQRESMPDGHQPQPLPQQEEHKDVPDPGTLQKEEHVAEKGDPSEGHKPPKPQNLENREAIPTAGGERLGNQHWGESKVVPENPAPRPSMAEGATGGANDNKGKNGNDHEGGKEGLMGKVKNILNK